MEAKKRGSNKRSYLGAYYEDLTSFDGRADVARLLFD